MDVASQFRSLVIDKSIQGVSACHQYFAFQTVFYIDGSFYCCCRCAYDHEYFTYISDTGEINEERFVKLAKAVECGYCEHAKRIRNKDYLKETKVYAIHVVAALGSEGMADTVVTVLDEEGLPLRHSCRSYNRRTFGRDTETKHSGIFGLTPCNIGCLKHNGAVLRLLNTYDHDKEITCAVESANNMLHVDKISILQFCCQENIIEDARFVIDYLDKIKNQELLFKIHFNCIIKQSFERFPRDFAEIGELAIIYNQYDIFVTVVNTLWKLHACVCVPGYKKAWEILTNLVRAAVAFQRIEFQEYVDLPTNTCVQYSSAKLIDLISHEISATSSFECLLRLFVKYELSTDRIRIAMEQIPGLNIVINERNENCLTPLQSYICETKTLEVSVVRTLIDLGANIDIPIFGGGSVLTYILDNIYNYKEGFREVLELLLYENISPAQNESEVNSALRHFTMIDAEKQYVFDTISSGYRMPQNNHFLKPGTYVMDAALHDNVFAYIIPLLIEAGFKYSLSAFGNVLAFLEDSSATSDSSVLPVDSSGVVHGRRELRAPCPHEKSINHKHVKAYLQRCSVEPRPLMLRCRDVLRTHFPRRQIHQYVSSVDIPDQIRDFLLLKPILRLPLIIKSENQRD